MIGPLSSTFLSCAWPQARVRRLPSSNRLSNPAPNCPRLRRRRRSSNRQPHQSSSRRSSRPSRRNSLQQSRQRYRARSRRPRLKPRPQLQCVRRTSGVISTPCFPASSARTNGTRDVSSCGRRWARLHWPQLLLCSSSGHRRPRQRSRLLRQSRVTRRHPPRRPSPCPQRRSRLSQRRARASSVARPRLLAQHPNGAHLASLDAPNAPFQSAQPVSQQALRRQRRPRRKRTTLREWPSSLRLRWKRQPRRALRVQRRPCRSP